jgi:hypothetical protein
VSSPAVKNAGSSLTPLSLSLSLSCSCKWRAALRRWAPTSTGWRASKGRQRIPAPLICAVCFSPSIFYFPRLVLPPPLSSQIQRATRWPAGARAPGCWHELGVQ